MDAPHPLPHTVFRFCRNIETEAARVTKHIHGVRTNYKTQQWKLSKFKGNKCTLISRSVREPPSLTFLHFFTHCIKTPYMERSFISPIFRSSDGRMCLKSTSCHRSDCLYGFMKEIPQNCMYNSSWRWTLGWSKHVEGTIIELKPYCKSVHFVGYYTCEIVCFTALT